MDNLSKEERRKGIIKVPIIISMFGVFVYGLGLIISFFMSKRKIKHITKVYDENVIWAAHEIMKDEKNKDRDYEKLLDKLQEWHDDGFEIVKRKKDDK